VECPSTGDTYFLGVPRIKLTETCRGAEAWTFGAEKEEDYAPEFHT